MSQERLNRVLVGPIVSEKSTMLADKNNQIAFRVVKDATKKEVKDAVELLFKVPGRIRPGHQPEGQAEALWPL